MPVHIENKDVQRQRALAKVGDDRTHVLRVVVVPPREPHTEVASREDGHAPANCREVGERAEVVVPMSKQVEVVSVHVAEHLARAVGPPVVRSVQARHARLVDQRPSGSRHDTPSAVVAILLATSRWAALVAVQGDVELPVERADGAAQISRIRVRRHPKIPALECARRCGRCRHDFERSRCECSACVSEPQISRGQSACVRIPRELGHRLLPIHKRYRRAILKTATPLSILDAEQARGEHREPGFSCGHDGFLVGDGLVGVELEVGGGHHQWREQHAE